MEQQLHELVHALSSIDQAILAWIKIWGGFVIAVMLATIAIWWIAPHLSYLYYITKSDRTHHKALAKWAKLMSSRAERRAISEFMTDAITRGYESGVVTKKNVGQYLRMLSTLFELDGELFPKFVHPALVKKQIALRREALKKQPAPKFPGEKPDQDPKGIVPKDADTNVTTLSDRIKKRLRPAVSKEG